MSVFERPPKSGHWYLSVTVNGKRIRKAIKEARTRSQAERAERILRDEIYEKRFGEGGFRLFDDFVEKAYKPHAKEHKRGYYVELSILNVLIDRFGKKRLIDISTEDVETFKRERKAEFTSRGKAREKSTVNRDVAVLSAVFNLAKEYGEIKNNPVSNIKYYGNLNSRERVLSDDEEIVLFEKIKADINFSRQVEILLYTGMRRGELFKIEWRDIDIHKGLINLRKEITKTEKARSIPMSSNVKIIFESLLSELRDISQDDKIFPGKIWQASKFSMKFSEVCSSIGWKGLTIHSLRHTFATRCQKLGIDVFAQKALLGHAKLSMTDRYTHLSTETLKENLFGFEEYVNKRKQ